MEADLQSRNVKINIEKAKRPCIEVFSVHGRFADGH